ncbi:MAG: peptidoglycan-binding protein [Holosporales bacterium]|jgi:chemotaxis protein MotB|nr:peptidoglycan-binding protein [Holosporales bacterium]
MSFARRSKNQEQVDIWPGFVDALSTVLLVFIFVLVGFISSQIYLSGIIFDRDSSLADLRSRLSKVCTLLDTEKDHSAKLTDENSDLIKKIVELNESIATLQGMFDKEEILRKTEHSEKVTLEEKIDQLTTQLKDVLAALAAEQQNAEQQQKAIDYIKKENIKLSELSKLNSYRSEFFDRLQAIVKDKDGIKVSGDRFVFQSELFFDSASDEVNEGGKEQLRDLADIVKEIGKKIPKKVKWILRVDGHTDARPIVGGKFTSNWELSAARAISVVKTLIELGIDPERLVAAGFGENQPITHGTTPEDMAKNRRIEFKLDER